MQFFHISHTTLWPLPSPVVNVIVKCHCITNDVVTNQVMVLPPQFNISSSPHCPFSLNFIQSTTQKFFVVNLISQTLSHFIIAFLSQIRFHVQNSSTQPHGACHTVGQNQTPQCSFSILLHLYFHPFQLWSWATAWFVGFIEPYKINRSRHWGHLKASHALSRISQDRKINLQICNVHFPSSKLPFYFLPFRLRSRATAWFRFYWILQDEQLMALKPSQGISRYLTRPHKATNRARLMLICINQCMYNFQQNFILPSSCSTQLLLNQSMQFFISHTKTLASWPLPPQVVNCQMPLHKWQSRSRPKNYGLASTI